MRMWDRTTMTWEYGYSDVKTDMPVTDWHDPSKPHWHTIAGMRAVSEPDQCGTLTVTIKRVSISPTTERAAILERLKLIVSTVREVYTSFFYRLHVADVNEHSADFVFRFDLRRDVAFCDTAIILARAVLSGLNVQDPTGHYLTSFELTRETLVSFENAWITYANWLRIKHQLRVYAATAS